MGVQVSEKFMQREGKIVNIFPSFSREMHTFETVSAGLFNANGGEWKRYILLSSSPSSTSGNVIQVDLLRIVASAAQ